MASISEALAIAVRHHQAGRLDAAEQIYRQILAVDANHVDALHLLGVVAHQTGKHEAAVEYIQRAIRFNSGATVCHNNLGEAYSALRRFSEAACSYRRALKLQPRYAEAHSNLGNALKEQGKLDDAVASYRRAVKLKPDFAEAHLNLGNALQAQGKLDDAITCYRRAVKLKPDFAKAQNNLGNALGEQGQADEALACYRRALELKPDYAEAHNNLGAAFKEQGNLDDAIACYRRALELKTDYAEAYNNLGVALAEQKNTDEAAACYRRALELKPDYAEVHLNLGNVFKDQGALDEAIACCRRALALKPNIPEAHNNLGNAFYDQGKLEEAIACYARALELKPDLADAHKNRAHTWLLTGDWQRGWPEYVWRLKTKDFAVRRCSQPLWGGEPLAAKSILLCAEQGLGDTIQFVRFASVVKQQGATVIVECQRPLLGLLQGCPGVDQLIPQEEPLAAFDVHAPLLSVPGILKTFLPTIPAQVPYLFPQPALVEQWRKRLLEIEGFKVGIAWQGNRKYGDDRWRSIPLRYFAPLAHTPGVRLISLQKGAGTEQLAEVRDLFPVLDLGAELDQQSGPFLDTAAVMKNLDLVIASDTAAAHLAGALAVPVWVALTRVPDWRWLLDRSDSPWYPTMRLFRQRDRGNWQGVFDEIQRALCTRLASR